MKSLAWRHQTFYRNAGLHLTSGSVRAPSYTCIFCQSARSPVRRFTASARRNGEGHTAGSEPFRTRLRASLRKTKVEWKPIPVALGIGFLGLVQFYRVRQREQRRQEEEDEDARRELEGRDTDEAKQGRPKKRKRIKPSGPWYLALLEIEWCGLQTDRQQANSSHVHASVEGYIEDLGPFQ